MSSPVTIYDLPFTTYARGVLEAAKLVHLGQVEITSDREFLSLSGFGPKTVQQIRMLVPYRPIIPRPPHF